LFCGACDPVTLAFGGTAVAGSVAVRNDGGLTGSISDSTLQKNIEFALAKEDLWDFVEVCLKHKRAVVIGYVKDESQHSRIIQIVKDIDECKEVYDEVKVETDGSDASDFASDAGITSRIKSSLLFDGNVASPNYDVTTVRGIVYICGLAQSKLERDVVLNCARTTSGVKKVVSYIRIKTTSNSR
jgi:osmotically-inducible protein OsmY